MSQADSSSITTDALAQQLANLIGDQHVLTNAEQLSAYSSDIYRQGVTAELVIAPGSVDELSKAVALCTASQRRVVPRGGGFSYTGGYIPAYEHTVMVDLRRLNHIIEINSEDMFVTVECGCTWSQLYEALKAKGLRTPYFGPISGFAATVGGALSQGSFFMGSTQYGTTAETTLGLQVVLADGTLLKTGSAASRYAPSPFFRTYGPDLTGVFLGDTGALGFKAIATLRLIPFPGHHRYASYSFENDKTVLRALAQISRLGIAADSYAWDPMVVQRFAQSKVNVGEGLGYLWGVVRSGSSFIGGLKDAARIAFAGQRFASDSSYLLHATVDDANEAVAAERMKIIESIAREAGGVATEASIPRALRGTPFSYPNKILGTEGERWVPAHGLCPHSRAESVLAKFRAYMQSQATLIAEHKINWGVLFFAVGNNTTCIEPLFYWPDARLPSHDHLMQAEFRNTLPHQPANAAATEAMRTLRLGVIDVFTQAGCAHVQIGKTYKYKQSREPATYALLEAIKAAVDPHGRVNPGSLGLGEDGK